MTNQELEAAILCIIEKAYCAKYTGKLKIEELFDCNNNVSGYKLVLALNNVERPITMFMSGTQQDFLKYVEKELRSRHLHYTSYYTGYQVPVVDCDLDTSCSCNEKEK